MNPMQCATGPLLKNASCELAFRLRYPVPESPKACLLLLHGAGGNETNLAELASSLPPEWLVAFPRGPVQFARGQFAWVHVNFEGKVPSVVAAETELSRIFLLRFIAQLQTIYGVPTSDVVIAGFGQGGIMSASVALTQPENVGGFAVLSGRVLPELKPYLAAPERFHRLRAFIGHEQFDSSLPIVCAQRTDNWLSDLGVQHVNRFYPTGHMGGESMAADFLEWLKNFQSENN